MISWITKNIGACALIGCSSLVKIGCSPKNKNYIENDGVLLSVNYILISVFECPAGKSGEYVRPSRSSSVLTRTATSAQLPLRLFSSPSTTASGK